LPETKEVDRLRGQVRELESRLRDLEETKEALRISEERYALAMKGPNEGLWDWNPVSKELYLSARLLTLLGFPGDTIRTTSDEWLTWVHPADRRPYQKTLVAHLQGRSEHFEAEYRVRDKQGYYRWVLARGVALRDNCGIAYRMVGSIGDITDRKQAEVRLQELVEERTFELKEAMEAAKTANEAKSDFLAKMSHELRTPLNAIIGLSEMLCEDSEAVENAETVDALKRINRSGEHLLELINDILDLSKIEAGRVELIVSDFSVSSLFDQVQSTIQPLAGKNGNRLSVLEGESLGSIRNDPTRLRQVLLNLLSNACKFTKDGEITLTAARKTEENQSRIVFAVTDTGIGIPEDKIDQLFTDFAQLSEKQEFKQGGSGLGLSISLKIVQLMGGDIRVESREGKGSTFTVDLPVG